jgi:hypothetical protein
MDHERFKNITGAIQSLVVSVAVLVGGGWTLFEYNSLRSAEKARLEVEDLTTARHLHSRSQELIKAVNGLKLLGG